VTRALRVGAPCPGSTPPLVDYSSAYGTSHHSEPQLMDSLSTDGTERDAISASHVHEHDPEPQPTSRH